MPEPRATAPWLTVAAAGIGALSLLAGCSSSTHGPAGAQTAPSKPDLGRASRPDFQKLRDLAMEQEHRPIRATMNAAPPAGLEPSLVEANRSGTAPAEASEPLDAVVARLVAARPAPAARPVVAPTDADTALHLYISGREKLMGQELPAAIADLRKAVELDPGAGEAWRELGEAQSASGFRTDAQASFERALACGLEEPRVLERLARTALDRGDNAGAAALLARASAASPERSDPLLPTVIEVALARALAAQGYTAAARDAMLRAVSRSTQISASTRYGEEFGTIFRRQGELWREIGDMSCRLGQYERATQAYIRASELPALDGRSLTPRIVFASLRSGRPAAAGLAVLEDAAEQDGRLSDEQTELLGLIARLWPGGGAIASALEDLEHSLPAPVRPSVASGLALARAAVVPPERRAGVLRDHLDHSPRDSRAMIALFEAAPTSKRAAELGVDLVARTPGTCGRVGEALLRSRFDAQELQDAVLAQTASGPRSLLASRLLLLRGWPAQAARVAQTIPPNGPFAAEGALCRVEAAIRSGDLEPADENVKLLSVLPGSRGSLARALAWFQRNTEALDAITPELETRRVDPTEQIDDLVLAADLAISLGRGDAAEGWLKGAIALDETDDRAPSRLLSLYGPGGPKADSGKFNQSIRELRRTNPESRTLQGARVKELVRRALLEQAQDEALRLAQDEPADGYAIDLLLSVAKARVARDGPEALAPARAWVEGQLARRPGAAPLLAGLSGLLAAAGEPQLAEARVREAMDAGAGPDASRVLEHILRDDLKRPQEADAMTMQRLATRRRLPGESLELADCYARNNDDARTSRTILDAFPATVTISPEQTARILTLAATISQRAIAAPDADRRTQCAALFDMLAQRGVTFTPELHERRLQLLALTPDADADRILDAAALTAAQYPNLGPAPYLRASAALAQANRSAVALVLIAKATDRAKDPSIDLFIEWTRVIAAAGTAAHGRVMIEKAQSAGKLKELVDRFEGPAPAEAPARDLRAEAAYFLGNLFASGKRPEQADGAYELALQYDPQHAWSLNNLGYSILERGGDTSRASTLLERAHAAMPEEGSITDSLGWLRYKQAIIEDQHDATGVISKRGAVSLLQSAAMTDRGRNDPTILNHLADALWLAGRSEEARRYWQICEQLVSRLLAPRPAPGDNQDGAAGTLSAAAIEEYRTIKESASAKRRAAAAGEAVHVAPQLANPDPKPAVRTDTPPKPEEPAKPDAPAGGKTVEQ